MLNEVWNKTFKVSSKLKNLTKIPGILTNEYKILEMNFETIKREN